MHTCTFSWTMNLWDKLKQSLLCWWTCEFQSQVTGQTNSLRIAQKCIIPICGKAKQIPSLHFTDLDVSNRWKIIIYLGYFSLHFHHMIVSFYWPLKSIKETRPIFYKCNRIYFECIVNSNNSYQIRFASW